MRLAYVVVLPALLLGVAGCGEEVRSSAQPAAATYAGPLHVTRTDAERPGAGAAGEVVDCDTWGRGGFNDQEPYGEGATADSPEGALDVARSEWLFGGVQEGLELAAEEQDRVLYVVEVDGVVKQAVVVRDGPATEGAGGDGWYVESWAHCDYAELPREFTDSIGLGIWTDEDGRPVPTGEIASWQGPEHCDWQSMTFLYVGGEGRPPYVREPQRGLGDYFDEPYRAHAELPDDAVDTGFQRAGDHLWLDPDGERAYVGSRDDVEVWPRDVGGLGCE